MKKQSHDRSMVPFAVALLLTALLLASAGQGFAAPPKPTAGKASEPVSFMAVRAILSDKCFACHGPDAKHRKADLRLDTKEGAFADLGGYKAIVPGKPMDSEAFLLMISDDDSERMPPKKFGKPLKTEEIELIKRWIEQGAPWQEHWAFVAPAQAKLPAVKDKTWPTNGIDHFVLARLEAESLRPNPQADKRVLARRVTLDLTGLPPTPEEVDAFVQDNRPDAYERLVERLLASPRYGEHMGRFWLDLARYGDTHGLHLDNYREMWPYRDWVIRAFNANKPFDAFVTEQLAGDLLPKPTTDQLVATGFNRAHVTTSEGGSIAEEVYTRNVVDRVNTTGAVFMGLTMGCTQCHDHKFDPITMKDYYAMFAFFNSLEANPLDGNRKDHAPVIRVPSPEQSELLALHDKQIAAIEAKLKQPWPEVDAKQRAWELSLKQHHSAEPVTWAVLKPETFKSQGGATLTKLPDQSILASGPNPAKEVYEVIGHVDGDNLTAIRLEGLVHDSLTLKGAGRSVNSNVVLTGIEAEIAPLDALPTDKKAWKPIRFAKAWADHEQTDGNFKISNAIDGNAGTGWAVDGHRRRQDRTAIFVADRPFGIKGGAQLRVRQRYESVHSQHQFGRVRLSVTDARDFPQFGGFVRLEDWHALGPFIDRDPNRAFSRNFGPEGKPFNAKQQFTADSKKIGWVKQPTWADGKVQYVLKGNNAATYLYRRVYASTAQKVKLKLGSDDGLVVWVNGKKLLSKNQTRAATPNADTVTASLKAGHNDLLLKVVNHSGSYGYYFQLEADAKAMPQDIIKIATLDPAKRTIPQAEKLRSYYRRSVADAPQIAEANASLADLRKKRNEVNNSVPTTLIWKERAKPKDSFLLKRGAYDQPDKELGPIPRATPAALPAMPKGAPMNRLGFAAWLLDASNPLTARVTVNRYWQQLFGVGLVKTSEDFGSQGEPPSHPQLLDYLAVEFRKNGWDIKRFMRTLVMSSTYRQSSKLSAGSFVRDPENRLLARGPRFRLDAEVIRDQALATSGLLVNKIGGPGVKPPQPGGLWFAVGYTSSNTARFKADKGPEKVHRRSLYTFFKRTAPPPQMSTFDAPSRESCTVRRERTNTPLQALLLMNDPQFVEAARAMAQRVVKEGGKTDAERIAHAFKLATLRPISTTERSLLLGLLNEQRVHYRNDKDAAASLIAIGEAPRDPAIDPVELASWTMLCNTLLNLDEVLNKN